MSLIVDRRNLDFVLFELLQVEQLFQAGKFAHLDRDVVDQMLDTSQRLAENVYRPAAAKIDQEEPRLSGGRILLPPETAEGLRTYADAGLFAQTFDREIGGLQLPATVSAAINGMFMAANVALANYSILTIAAANLIAAFGSDAQKAEFLPPMLEGRWFGTMCLSEAQAGSSLADIETRADRIVEGTYAITGDKMWISGGEHELSDNIVHMVLARITGGPPGVKGISLFIVPRFRSGEASGGAIDNHVAVVGLNHKMGHRGTTNCALRFGDSGTTIGYLVGKPHHGLRYMFRMMNEARIAVGLGATMSGLAGYLYSLNYARERLQGRAIGTRDPEAPQVPIIEHPDVRRMLLNQKASVEGAIALCAYAASLVDSAAAARTDGERVEAELLLDLLTPVIKSWPSEYCLGANKLAIQILGGAGYTRDHPVERFYRDNRLNHIHEGSWGIQAIDLLGRKVGQHGGRAFELLGSAVEATAERAAREMSLSAYAHQLAGAWVQLAETTAICVNCDTPSRRLANATLYLNAFGHVVVAWLWLRQALVAVAAQSNGSSERAFYQGKLATCRYFFRYLLPHAIVDLEHVGMLDEICFDFLADDR